MATERIRKQMRATKKVMVKEKKKREKTKKAAIGVLGAVKKEKVKRETAKREKAKRVK